MTTFSTGKPRGEDSVPSILRLFIQILIHPQRRFGNPLRTFWAILCEPFSPKSRFFLDTPKFYTLYAGSPNVPPRVLAVWAKTLRGQWPSMTTQLTPSTLELMTSITWYGKLGTELDLEFWKVSWMESASRISCYFCKELVLPYI